MPRRREWSADEERLLREMRADNHTWEAIGLRLGRVHETVRRKAKLMGVWSKQVRPSQNATHEDAADDRGPLEPGHPFTWGAIVSGTVLDGCEYPGP